jgi:hypothetical protein
MNALKYALHVAGTIDYCDWLLTNAGIDQKLIGNAMRKHSPNLVGVTRDICAVGRDICYVLLKWSPSMGRVRSV